MRMFKIKAKSPGRNNCCCHMGFTDSSNRTILGIFPRCPGKVTVWLGLARPGTTQMNISYSCEESVRENRWAQRSQGSKEQLKNSLHCNTFFHKVRVNKTSDQCPVWKQELPSVSWTYKKRTKQNGKRSFAHNFPAPDSCLSSTPIHKHMIPSSFPKAFTVSVSKEDYLVHWVFNMFSYSIVVFNELCSSEWTLTA